MIVPGLLELAHMFFLLLQQLAHLGVVLGQQRRSLLVVGVVAYLFQLRLRIFRLYSELRF